MASDLGNAQRPNLLATEASHRDLANNNQQSTGTLTNSSAMTAAPMTFDFDQPLNAAGIGSSVLLGRIF